MEGERRPRDGRRKLVELLERSLPRLSPARRRVAEYVLRNYQEVAFMGVAELAKAAGVSPAAVVRFATSLDFRGYPEFQRALHGIVRFELRQGDRFTACLDVDSGEPLGERVIAQELQNVSRLRSDLDRASLTEAIRRIARAESVVIAGFRATSTLAHYLWYNLRKVKPGVRVYANPGSVTWDEMLLSDRRSLFLLIAFPRYSQELLELAEFVRRREFSSIAITDNELSPLAPLCDLALLVEVGEISFTDFYAAPIALMNALVAEVARALRRKALSRLNQLDDLAAERGYLFPAPKPRREG